MRFYWLVAITILYSCHNSNVNGTDSDDLLSFIQSQPIRDSLTLFLETSEKFPNIHGETIYSMDVSKHKQDTIISFWAYESVLYPDVPFDDARFLLEITNNSKLLLRYDWMELYHDVIGYSNNFVYRGIKNLGNDKVFALTVRNMSDIDDLVDCSKLNSEQFSRYEQVSIGNDRKPSVKIYKYSQGSLYLLYSIQDWHKEQRSVSHQ